MGNFDVYPYLEDGNIGISYIAFMQCVIDFLKKEGILGVHIDIRVWSVNCSRSCGSLFHLPRGVSVGLYMSKEHILILLSSYDMWNPKLVMKSQAQVLLYV